MPAQNSLAKLTQNNITFHFVFSSIIRLQKSYNTIIHNFCVGKRTNNVPTNRLLKSYDKQLAISNTHGGNSLGMQFMIN
jgi:hypothetical protein